jgi:aminoglycoside phosphotransferase family enzyme/predicted kinase
MSTRTPSNRGRDRGADPAAVRDAVARLDSTGGARADVEMRETHISWVFLTREHAYKLKKPLVLDFLDYGTAERRREMCLEEVRLNARLAGDVYIGVCALVRSDDGLRIACGAAPEAVDYLVQMRRYDEAQTLAAMIARSEASQIDAAAVGRRVARFHECCRVVCRRRGAAAVREEIERNLRELLAEIDSAANRARVLALGRFMRAFLESRGAELDQRAAGGRLREGHGDLRAEHVLLRPALRIVDCVEFDSSLRTLDVADDLAFLVMDLAGLGTDSLVRALVDAYRDAGGDCGDDTLLFFYAVHRALVRAKVDLVRAGQQTDRAGAEPAAIAAAEFRLTLAERLAWRARGPLAYVVCGLPASGKSTLTRALATMSGLPVLSSDVVRKELAGLDPHERAPDTVYGSDVSRRTYSELARRASSAPDRTGGVLVDATFRHREDREAFREATPGELDLVFIECTAPARVLAERAAARERDPARISDATAAVVRRELDAWSALDEVPPGAHIQLRTDRPVAAVIDDLTALLDERLAQSSGQVRADHGRW